LPKPLLLNRPSGLYVRFFVPVDLQKRVGCRYLIRSLRGQRADAARLVAAALGYALSRVFERLRREDVTDAKGLLDIALDGVKDGKVYDIELPNGTKIRTDGSEAEHQRVRETITDLEKAGAFSPAPSMAPANPKVGLLSERIEKFLAQMKVQERSETNHFDTAFSLRLFLGLVGDKDLSEVSHADLDTFMDALAHWPSNASKKKAYQDLSPKQVVEKSKTRDDPRLAARTKEKHLDRLRVFFNNCVERRLLIHNPCTGLRVTSKQQDEQETRQPFSEEDLQVIFDPQHHINAQPHKYWSPILGLYTGARVNELGQLRVADLEKIDGIWGLHIRHQVKNKSSKRFLPLHPSLLKLGFVEYVHEVKTAGFDLVFPGLPWGVHGPGDGIGDWFNRTYLRNTCEIFDPTKTFHSFRHVFASLAERSDLSDSRIARLTGHSTGTSILRRHYIQPSTLKERMEDMAKIRFPDLDIKMMKKGFFEPYFKRVKAVEDRAKRNKK